MQRQTAITTAATVSLVLLAGASAMAVNTGLLRTEGTGNVGQLAVVAEETATSTTVAPQPADAPPRTIIVTVPRQTAPPATVSPAAPAGSTPATRAGASPATTAPRAGASSTVPRSTSTTVDDDDHDDEDDRPAGSTSTSTTRPRGGDDDD